MCVDVSHTSFTGDDVTCFLSNSGKNPFEPVCIVPTISVRTGSRQSQQNTRWTQCQRLLHNWNPPKCFTKRNLSFRNSKCYVMAVVLSSNRARSDETVSYLTSSSWLRQRRDSSFSKRKKRSKLNPERQFQHRRLFSGGSAESGN